ncbi:MAG: hypothetical protein WBA68_02565 [Alteraurantiacibacter sp.]
MTKKPKPFERKGDWPTRGGSFVKQSGGVLKPQTDAAKADAGKPMSDARGGDATKDSGK